MYIPSAREIVELNMEEEKQLNAAVIDKGGVWNTSCLFLKNTCDAIVVNSTNSRKICSVALTSARHADFSRTKDACH